jgi:hypothetical protein
MILEKLAIYELIRNNQQKYRNLKDSNPEDYEEKWRKET